GNPLRSGIFSFCSPQLYYMRHEKEGQAGGPSHIDMFVQIVAGAAVCKTVRAVGMQTIGSGAKRRRRNLSVFVEIDDY
ncbi:MAG: hypothetical protein AAGU32_04920, partial [Bacillota bacterium]